MPRHWLLKSTTNWSTNIAVRDSRTSMLWGGRGFKDEQRGINLVLRLLMQCFWGHEQAFKRSHKRGNCLSDLHILVLKHFSTQQNSAISKIDRWFKEDSNQCTRSRSLGLKTIIRCSATIFCCPLGSWVIPCQEGIVSFFLSVPKKQNQVMQDLQTDHPWEMRMRSLRVT